MRKTILLALLLWNLSVSAQLNSCFYSVGNPTNISSIGAYGRNTFLNWRQVQQYPSSAYNWNYADGLIQTNQSAGLHTVLTLRCVHPINADDSTPGTCAYQFDNGTNDDNSNWPVVGSDTTNWKNFVNALVDRYDGDGTNDMPGLIYPVFQWHIVGQEYPRTWCSQYPDTSLASAQEFVKLVNMTYNVIKSKQPISQISFAGLTSHKTGAFYDGYYNEPSYCIGNCITNVFITHSQFASSPSFLANRRNTLYLMQHAEYDELDVHAYGEWNHISEVVKWLKDSASMGNKPVAFLEGGGPYCKTCENIYHSVNDTDGILPPPLVRDNASYIVYYFIIGIASGVSKLNWNLFPEYSAWGTVFGDLDLQSINNIPKPSAYTYRFLAQTIFSNQNADTIVRVTESDSNLYHYQINPLAMNVIWSSSAADSLVVSGTGTLYRWDIPTTCDSLYPTYCDSLVQQSSVNVNGSYTVHLYDGVPVFYSWNNVLTTSENISNADSYFVNIFPNPFSTQTVLRTDKNLKGATLTVYNLYGQTVKQIKNISGQTVTFSRDNLQSGLYFIQLTQGNILLSTDKIVITDN